MSERRIGSPSAGLERQGAATLIVGALSLAALAVAFGLQFGFGHAPCHLCVLERWPYVLAAAAAAGGVLTGRPRPALLVAGLALLGNAGLSGYHSGVEQGWFALPGGCVAGTGAASLDELRAQIEAASPTCDRVSLRLLGLSLASWNGLFALGLALWALSAAAATPQRPARGS